MKFHQFFVFLLCNYIFLLCYTSKAQTTSGAVVYEGPAVVNESHPFSLTCFTSHFFVFKWRQNGRSIDFVNSGNNSLVDGKNDTLALHFSTLMINSVSSEHSGTYRCTSERDDYGHNLTVISAPPNIKLKIEFDDKHKCEASYVSKAEKCIRGELYKPISLKCSNDGGPWNSSLALHWYAAKDDNNVQGEYVPLKETGNSHVKVFDDGRIEFTQLSAQDINYYKCKAVLKTGSAEKETLISLVEVLVDITALPKLAPIVKDMTVVEGNTINVTCAVTGKATHVIWKFGDKIMSNGSESRVKTEEFRGVKDATLLIQHANATTDRGLYNCTAVSVYGNSSSQGSFVRIKSKYAALGPFLGICAEVIILCTIILIYEKKRDKTELEESDTDQGPETKSSPDHGQDSVRYRK